MTQMNELEIAKWIRTVKQSEGRVHTNCFYHFSDKTHLWETDSSKKSLYIVNYDHGVKRVWFYTTDFEDLKELFCNSLEKTEEYLIDIVTKDRSRYGNELTAAGFQPFTSMMRMSNKDISKLFDSAAPVLSFYDEEVGIQAVLEDAESVKDKLWEVFDPRISHLPDLDEVRDSIVKGEITIYKENDSGIITLLQSVVEPKCFYINQVYNASDKKIIHAIMLSRLKQYVDKGGRYLYAWVEETNIASCKFHRKYDLSHDGLWDIVYIRHSIT